MAWTKNGTRKNILLRLIGIFLVCFINKGASNANSCPNPRYIENKNHVIVANCLASARPNPFGIFVRNLD